MRHPMIKNAILLGFSGFCAKGFDFIFRAYYSQQLGREGMGLLSLGFGIHSVMITVSTAGLGVAVSKAVSKYLIKEDYNAIKKCMKIALYTVVVLSMCVLLITLIGVEWIAQKILGDIRIAASLCCLTPSILFMGISYCLKGFFYASRNVRIPALSEFLEQAVKGVLISFFLQLFLKKGIEYGCMAVFLGITLGELTSCTFLTFCYTRQRMPCSQKKSETGQSETGLRKELFCVAFPSMITSLISSVLRMQEEVWIVVALERYGMNHHEALSCFGVLYGMVMPMLVLPLNLIGSVSTLLVPEISRADAMYNSKRKQRLIKKTYFFGALAGGVVTLLFQGFPEEISYLIYSDITIVPIVRSLSFVCPIMFFDYLSCSVLNGMGKQFSLLCYSLADSFLRLLGIFVFVPIFGMNAMTSIIVFSNFFTCFLTVFKVLNNSGFTFSKMYQKIKSSPSQIL